LRAGPQFSLRASIFAPKAIAWLPLILIWFFPVWANWLIGLAWLAGYTALMISRVPEKKRIWSNSTTSTQPGPRARPVSSTHS
jgi:hypothetical protein